MRTWYSHTLLVGMQNVTPLENRLTVSYKVKQTLITQSSNSTPGIHPKEITYIDTNICVPMFVTDLFMINKNWK